VLCTCLEPFFEILTQDARGRRAIWADFPHFPDKFRKKFWMRRLSSNLWKSAESVVHSSFRVFRVVRGPKPSKTFGHFKDFPWQSQKPSAISMISIEIIKNGRHFNFFTRLFDSAIVFGTRNQPTRHANQRCFT
jgi:hypothetical protein